MKPPLKLRTITFTRTVGGVTVAGPVRRTSSSPEGERAQDWIRRTDASVRAWPVAIYSAAGSQGCEVMVSLSIAGTISGDLYVRARDTAGGPLGDLNETRLGPTKSPGTKRLTMTLEDPAAAERGIAFGTVSWFWEFSIDRTQWHPFDESRHQIFITIAQPAPPWGGGNGPTPWNAAMALACRWSRGRINSDQCAEAIAHGVNDLGGQVIHHSPGYSETIRYVDGGSCTGIDEEFFLTNFIDAANLKPDSVASFNCEDCASAVAILSAVIGSPLRILSLISSSERESFCTRRVRLLGAPDALLDSFKFHEAAASVIRGSADAVWDACLEVDLDDQPRTHPPATLGIAAGLPLTSVGPPGYVDRLAHDSEPPLTPGWAAAEGLRFPEKNPDGFVAPADARREWLRNHYLALFPSLPAELPGDLLRMRPLRATDVLLPLTLTSNEMPLRRRGAPHGLTLYRRRIIADQISRSVLQVSHVTADDVPSAVDVFLHLASSFSRALVPLPSVGDAALHNARSRAVLFLRGTTVLRIVAPDDPDAAIAAAGWLDGLLAAP